MPVPIRNQRLLLVAVLFAVACADQLTKAWAWRNLVDVHINSGGDLLVSPGIGAWFRDPVRGAALDVLDFAALLLAWLFLGRRRRPTVLVLPAAVLLAGWTSNLFDRLGMHYWTAPDSVRGVVDFIPWLHRYWNVADMAIIVGSVTLAAAILGCAARAAVAPRRRRVGAAVTRPLVAGRARMAAAGSVLTAAVLAAIGSVAYAGISEPLAVLATGH